MRGSATRLSDSTTKSASAAVTVACGWLLCLILAPEHRSPSAS
jgi:hypothetical protein